jgi:2,4-dienoyl-CoA reductase-like NADH-dependent reductase (Old Yellow Enzyme family)
MWMREDILPILKKLTDAVHKEGAAASIQLGHCGFFANKSVTGQTPIGPSRKFCLFRYSLSREMKEYDLRRVSNDFTNAALMARGSGFDAVEIHAGHGYLLSQFLSPWTNSRTDTYGGTLENRARFPVQVISQVRQALGADFPILVKMNCEDGFSGGLTLEESVKVSRLLASAGASLIIPSCGFTARTSFYMMRGQVPILEYIKSEKNPITKVGMALFGRLLVREYPFKELYLLDQSREIKNAVNIPVAYLGGICSSDNLNLLMQEGFEFVQVGRATVRDPDFVRKLQTGEISKSDCDHCNRCVAEMAVKGISCSSAEKGLRIKRD